MAPGAPFPTSEGFVESMERQLELDRLRHALNLREEVRAEVAEEEAEPVPVPPLPPLMNPREVGRRLADSLLPCAWQVATCDCSPSASLRLPLMSPRPGRFGSNSTSTSLGRRS
jgi:hypothetical protein